MQYWMLLSLRTAIATGGEELSKCGVEKYDVTEWPASHEGRYRDNEDCKMRDSTGRRDMQERGMQPFDGRLGNIFLRAFSIRAYKNIVKMIIVSNFLGFSPVSMDLWPFRPAMSALAPSILGGWATAHYRY